MSPDGSRPNDDISLYPDKGWYLFLDHIRSDLADRSLDKRRAAVGLIDRQIRIWDRHDPGLITKLIRSLVCDIGSDMPFCKSALLAISVCAVTLQHDYDMIKNLYSQSVNSVISVIRNGTSLRHLLLACECLYNISKVSRSSMVEYVADIFPSIAGLITCSDPAIRTATENLNLLLKDAILDDRASRIHLIIPALEKVLLQNDPFSRNFALGWIRLLHCSNHFSVMFTLPAVLAMLNDRHPDVAVNARSFITSIWHQLPTIQCLRVVTRIAADRGQSSVVRQTALRWIPDLVKSAPDSNVSSVAITVLLQCLDDPCEQITNVAANSHQELFNALQRSSVFLDADCIVGPRSQTAALEYLLAYVRQGGSFACHESFQLRLLRILLDSPFREIKWILEILIRIAISQNSLSSMLRDLIRTINCSRESRLEKKRCIAIVNFLSELLGGNVLYDAVVSLRSSELSPMTIHTMLFTIFFSDSLLDFRMHLQSPQSSEIFCRLFAAWISNPIALIGLCLFGRFYELAFWIIASLDSVANFWSIDAVEQIVQLIELLDSPVFLKIRLDILDIQLHPFLFKAIYGLIALVPHCKCASLLGMRLQSAILTIQYFTPKTNEGTAEANVDIAHLYNVFYSSYRKSN